MQFLFDHIAAVVVSSALLLVFAAVQQRGQQSAIAAERQHAVKTSAQGYLQMLEQDIENMGSRVVRSQYECELRTDGSNTTLFHFSTLGDPRSAAPSTENVTYRLEPFQTAAGMQRTVDVQGTARPLYRLERWEGGTYDEATGRVTGGTRAGGGRPVITQFTVELRVDGPGGHQTSGRCSSMDVRSVEVSLMAALQSVEELTASQKAVHHVNTSRYGVVITPPSLERLFP